MNKRKNKWVYSGGLLVAAALLATGCGGGKSESSASPPASQAAGGDGGAQAITINAKNFEFEPKEIKVKKGDKIALTLKNAQGNHALKIEGYGQEVKGNQTVTFTADQTGEFKFDCSIMCGAGHKDMIGKLIVE